MNYAIQSTRDFNCIFIHSTLDDFGLTPYEFRVFAHISRRASSGSSWASYATMAAICCMCEDKVKQCLKTLEEYGLITRESRPGKSTLFRIAPPNQWVVGTERFNGYPPDGNGGVNNHPQVANPPHPPDGNGGDPPDGNPPEGDPVRKSKKGGSRFAKPTLDEVLIYANEIGLPRIEVDKFYDRAESIGWLVGRNPMKDWRAALRNWKRNSEQWSKNTYGKVNGVTNPRLIGVCRGPTNYGEAAKRIQARQAEERRQREMEREMAAAENGASPEAA